MYLLKLHVVIHYVLYNLYNITGVFKKNQDNVNNTSEMACDFAYL